MSDQPTPSEIQLKIRELLGRATLLRARGDRQQALLLLQQAIDLDDESWEAHELLGDLLLDLNRADQALQTYRRARELNKQRAVLEEKIGRAAIARAARLRSTELSQALLQGRPPSKPLPRKPGYAALFSLVVPGLGQVYNGQVLKGFLMMMAYLVLFALAAMAVRGEMAIRPAPSMGTLYGPQIDAGALLSSLFSGVSGLWIGLLLALWIYSIADAAIRAGRTMTSDDTGLV